MTTASAGVPTRNVLGIRVAASNYDDVVATIREWATQRESRTVNVLAVHGVMEAYDDRSFQQLMNKSDLNVSDGMPVVWSLKLFERKTRRESMAQS